MANKVEVWDVPEGHGEGPYKMVVFCCPGCGESHGLPVEGTAPTMWQWNGSLESPTLTPSILARCTTNLKGDVSVCHSFVADGRIQFLGDCTHKLAGQTVDLPNYAEPVVGGEATS